VLIYLLNTHIWPGRHIVRFDLDACERRMDDVANQSAKRVVLDKAASIWVVASC